jgi:hypothetical protein
VCVAKRSPHDSPLCADLRPQDGGGSHHANEQEWHTAFSKITPPLEARAIILESTVMSPSSMSKVMKLLPGAPASVIRVHSSNRGCLAWTSGESLVIDHDGQPGRGAQLTHNSQEHVRYSDRKERP